MPRALIIEGDMIIGHELSSRLAELGFDCLDHVCTEEGAVARAHSHPPDLVVVGDEIASGNSVRAARRICMERNVPVLLATRDKRRQGERLAEGAVLDGPFSFSKLPEAICMAENVSQHA